MAAGKAGRRPHRMGAERRLYRAAAQRPAPRARPPFAVACLRSRPARSIIISSPATDMDGVISGYRALTGKAPMMPEWAYGFWQSRQRYNNQEEVLDVVARVSQARPAARQRSSRTGSTGARTIGAATGSIPKRFPDPKGMVDEVHALNARFMISVWPKFYPTTEHYKELTRRGRASITRNLRSEGRRTGSAPAISTPITTRIIPRAARFTGAR